VTRAKRSAALRCDHLAQRSIRGEQIVLCGRPTVDKHSVAATATALGRAAGSRNRGYTRTTGQARSVGFLTQFRKFSLMSVATSSVVGRALSPIADVE
jgi:hypothetical protein